MIRAFIQYFLFLMYIETVLHIACFKEVNLFSFFMLSIISITVAGILSFITTISKSGKMNQWIMRIICSSFLVVFIAEIVYFKIYESFFSFNGIQFAGALKDGYDKILLTIFQNIIPILFLCIPVLFFLKKLPKLERAKKSSTFIIALFTLISSFYVGFSVLYINSEDSNSLYNLVYKKNLPIMNVKKMGLVASTSLSLERKIFGFQPMLEESEDIYDNKKTALADVNDVHYNVDYDISFEKLIENEKNETISSLHTYFSKQQPTELNDYTGIFQDKNVILILAESFDEIAISETLTPTLYKLKHEGIIFNNYFSPKYPASTADGEYMLEWATLPIIGENYSLIDMVYNTNPYILPRILKTLNYKTYVFHNYVGYYNRRNQYFSTLNFDGHRYCGDGMELRCEFFHGSDMDMMDQTIGDYINQDRFFAYYITLSGHGSYDSSNFVATKHLSKVQDLPYSYQIKHYLAANIDFDLAMEKLVKKLEEAGKLDDTLIVISSDHSPYYLSNYEVNSVSSIDRDNKFDRNRGSLIIYNSAFQKEVQIAKYAMNIDVLPTLLNMLNIRYDSRIIIGKDIMASNNDGVVIFPDRSWVNNKGSYDSVTGKFNSYVENIDDKYVSKITNEVNEKYEVSVSMQYNDYYKYLFE